jgi:glycosyltransferase involved in cell wall biosynthesis
VEWELLVVDNGSTDGTDLVIDTFAGRLPLRKLREDRPGKSFALNHAVAGARGAYLVFTDDDVLVGPNWLAAYAAAFQQWPGDAVFGGPIAALFEGTPPRWLGETRDMLGGVYAERDFGGHAIALTDQRVPFGANMAIRAADHGPYRYPTSLGPGRGDMVRGEDTAVVRTMFANGLSGRWVPEARVQHVIPEARQTLRYIRRYYIGHGRQLAAEGFEGPTWWGRPRWVWRAAADAGIRYGLARVRHGPSGWMADLVAASVTWGRLLGPRFAASDAVPAPRDGAD